jgi:uncharacterized protein YceK
VLSLLLAGCGTVNTVVRGDTVASRNLKEIRSYCDSIPRVYSGVSYDFCTLYGPPPSGYGWNSGNLVETLIYDLVLSGLLDTVALPYTIYRQSVDGNIDIGSR